ncbi:MAG: hypothetical protein COS84_09265, partial [Armatimonadetes bacterium CG07_land_8_20_14_0_80_40_9]
GGGKMFKGVGVLSDTIRTKRRVGVSNESLTKRRVGVSNERECQTKVGQKGEWECQTKVMSLRSRSLLLTGSGGEAISECQTKV